MEASWPYSRRSTHQDSALRSIDTWEAEIFRVLEGRYLFQVNDKRFDAAEGDVVCVPGGAVHAFVNITNRPARQLVLMLPGMDASAFFLGLSEVFLTRPSRDDLNAFGKPWEWNFWGHHFPSPELRPDEQEVRCIED